MNILETRHDERQNDEIDQLSSAFTSLRPLQSQGPVIQYVHDNKSVAVHDQSRVHFGDVYYVDSKQESTEAKAFGLCWGSAPLISADNFIGRETELDQMSQCLQPGLPGIEQRRLVLGGMGGIGKTQLTIAYARRYHTGYPSTFWFNASTESTIKEAFRSVALLILGPEELETLNDQQVVLRVHSWLANPKNSKWLLIFDNYDEPDQFDIGEYIPNSAHGSVIFTTRLPSLIGGQQMNEIRVQPIDNLDESLQILQSRSLRENVRFDSGAYRLAERLAGLPLALATAGAYLRKTNLTFIQYLETYERNISFDSRRPLKLQEYQNRTLNTTWNLSYNRLESDDPLAAKALKLFAFLDNQDISYELLHAGLGQDTPIWLDELAEKRSDFENVMGTLVEYCLVETNSASRSYTMHNCVHDWTLDYLNKNIDQDLYWYIIRCISQSINDEDEERLGQPHYAQLARHALRCTHERLEKTICQHAPPLSRAYRLHRLADLLRQQVQYSAAEMMYTQTLAGYRTGLGPEHPDTSQMISNVGNVYGRQGKLAEAEQMHKKALEALENKLGPDHTLVLSVVNNLGNIYETQGKLSEAQTMLERSVIGFEKLNSPDNCILLAEAMNNLGIVYNSQGKSAEAEQIYRRALANQERAVGTDRPSTLNTINNLARLLSDGDELDEAEQLYKRALEERTRVLGPEHPSIMQTLYELGCLYRRQDRNPEAEQMFQRQLYLREKVQGPDHRFTLWAMYELGTTYYDLDKVDEAERISQRALAACQETSGTDQALLKALNDLLRFTHMKMNGEIALSRQP